MVRYAQCLLSSSSCSLHRTEPVSLTVRQHGERKRSVGLHRDCSSVTGICDPFPDAKLCNKDKYFCSMWRTVGFLITFDVVVELCTLVAFAVIIAGGVQRRAVGWKIITSLLLFSGIVQCAGMAIVVRSYAYVSPHSSIRGAWATTLATWVAIRAQSNAR